MNNKRNNILNIFYLFFLIRYFKFLNKNGYYDLSNPGCGIKKGLDEGNNNNIILNKENLEKGNNNGGKCCYYY